MPLIFIELESLQTQSLPVWPDLVKFHHFDQYLKIFGNIFKVYLVLGKVFSSLWYNLYAFGQIFIAENGQILKTQSGRLVTLVVAKVEKVVFGTTLPVLRPPTLSQKYFNDSFVYDW